MTQPTIGWFHRRHHQDRSRLHLCQTFVALLTVRASLHFVLLARRRAHHHCQRARRLGLLLCILEIVCFLRYWFRHVCVILLRLVGHSFRSRWASLQTGLAPASLIGWIRDLVCLPFLQEISGLGNSIPFDL